jgi:hypothetical protein
MLYPLVRFSGKSNLLDFEVEASPHPNCIDQVRASQQDELHQPGVERQFRKFQVSEFCKNGRKNMNNKSIAKLSPAGVLALIAALGPAWAQPSKTSLASQNSGGSGL